MTINLSMPAVTELKPKITVLGVGGAGGNAVNNMINAQLDGVEFVVANTDAQALAQSMTDRRIQLGVNVTRGLGAGSNPDVGRQAAEETLSEVMESFSTSHMVFITAGMGGGTGTGAAPVIAQAAREAGILTVGVATKPFQFEGAHRMAIAEAGIEAFEGHVDTLIIIPNQNLFRVANDKTTFADAFKMADDVLYSGVRGVTDLMVMPGLINLDFADVRAVMMEMGKAMMGTGESEGEKRAIDAAEAAISNPLLDDVSMKGARGVLINITGGPDMTLYEVDEAANRIRDEVDADANIIFGSIFDESLQGRIRVSVVATGIDTEVSAIPRVHTLYGNATPMDRPMPLEVATSGIAASQPALAFAVEAPGAPRPVAQAAMQVSGPVSGPVAGPVAGMPMPQTVGSAALAQAEPEALLPVQVEAAAQPLQAAARPALAEPRSMAPAHEPEAQAEVQVQVQAAPQARELPKGKEEPFIAPRPAQPARGPATRLAPDAFAEAAVTNARPEEKKRRGPSLFERMTGTGRSRSGEPPSTKGRAPSRQTKEPRPPTPPAAPKVQSQPPVAPPPAQRTAVPAAQAVSAPAADAGRLAPPPEDELLEIPAFLRRQAN